MASHDHATDQFSPSAFALPPLPERPMSEPEFREWALELGKGARVEWIGGEVIMMSPVNYEHSEAVLWLGAVLRGYVEHHELGVVTGPELLVRLPEQRTDRVPDLLFSATEHADRVKPTHIEGPPDLCIEIVSPDSQARDWREKYLEYEAAGVHEYWVIDPMSRRAEFYALETTQHRQDAADGQGTAGQASSGTQQAAGPVSRDLGHGVGPADTGRYVRLPEKDGVVASRVLPGLKLPVKWLWSDTRPKVLDALRELEVIG